MQFFLSLSGVRLPREEPPRTTSGPPSLGFSFYIPRRKHGEGSNTSWCCPVYHQDMAYSSIGVACAFSWHIGRSHTKPSHIKQNKRAA
ncbi:hypothetical protein LX32DRAFT_242660 [Colletotrichum zoysiae]|uniref:Uncharacterized protein n=1 Tax=Colletotrichum zoysiae TaxID=1216348 RepID=A0AAD9H371_9PEZI|nr:hypothetical protein LX32DRAFT_242660 [Colletotrichum zoysiae]